MLRRVSGRAVHVVDCPGTAEPPDFSGGKRRLVLQRRRGTFLQACPAGTSGLVCCNYLVVSFASNCPFDCSYCFLQEYLTNNPAVKAFTNVEDGLAEIDAVLQAHPKRSFRIGTGELADSLALDPLTALSPRLVRFFAERPNATLELKTKSDAVDELLTVDPKGRVVVSWSVNPAQVIAGDEQGTASLDARLRAARRVQACGYQLGFHFDPLIELDGWESAYRHTVETIRDAVDARGIMWISLGSLRLTPRLLALMRSRPVPARVLGSELVPGPDGKARVWRGLRLKMYRVLRELLREAWPVVPVYLCMETPGVWEHVMHEVPSARDLGRRLAAPNVSR